MLKHQKIDWICAAVMALAAAAAVLFMNGEKLGLIPASSSPGYESRLFDKSKVHQVEILIEDWEGFLQSAPQEEYHPCTIRIDGDKSGLIAGITAKAELLIREAKDVFCVPATAVFEEEDSSYIAVVDNMRFKRIPVDVGVDGDVEVQVTAKDGTALAEGMQVVVSPDAQMADGTAVMITEGGGI